jgi:hypothetical protein
MIKKVVKEGIIPDRIGNPLLHRFFIEMRLPQREDI